MDDDFDQRKSLATADSGLGSRIGSAYFVVGCQTLAAVSPACNMIVENLVRSADNCNTAYKNSVERIECRPRSFNRFAVALAIRSMHETRSSLGPALAETFGDIREKLSSRTGALVRAMVRHQWFGLRLSLLLHQPQMA